MKLQGSTSAIADLDPKLVEFLRLSSELAKQCLMAIEANQVDSDTVRSRDMAASMLKLLEFFEKAKYYSNRPFCEPVAQLFPIDNKDLSNYSSHIFKMRGIVYQFDQAARHSPDTQAQNELLEADHRTACTSFAPQFLGIYNDAVQAASQFGFEHPEEFPFLIQTEALISTRQL